MNTVKRDKIAGAVYGFAIGDAMGATTEFLTAKQVKTIYGKVKNIIGGGWLNLKAGEVTDDTQMTACVMNALMEYPDDIDKFESKCAENFVTWFCTKPKDIGGQCSRGIYSIISGHYIEEDENALGNGSLMRAMPCAILNKPFFNVAQGILTHNNQECTDIIWKYTRILQDYLNGNNKYLSIYKNINHLKPSGCIKNTFNNSIYWSNKSSFKDAILGAVNDGGDADTIAAITGSLAGARFGLSNIPKKWIDQLDSEVKEFLENFINFVFSYLQI